MPEVLARKLEAGGLAVGDDFAFALRDAITTDAHLTLLGGRSLDAVSARATSLLGAAATLVGGSAVTLVGLDPLASPPALGARAFAWLRDQLGAITDALAGLRGPAAEARASEADTQGKAAERDAEARGARPAQSAADPEAKASTISALDELLAAEAHAAGVSSARAIAAYGDEATAASEPRTAGAPATPAGAPHLVLGARASAALFSQGTTLVHGERSASLSADDTARVVAGAKVDVSSPEEVEMAGRRATRVSSANLLDLRAAQVSVRAGGSGEAHDGALPTGVSAAVIAEQSVRLRSAEGDVVACAQRDVVLHAHEGGVRLGAHGAIEIAGGAVACAGKRVTITAEEGARIEAGGAEIIVEGGVVTIRAPAIRLVGNVSVEGALSVSGGIRGTLVGG